MQQVPVNHTEDTETLKKSVTDHARLVYSQSGINPPRKHTRDHRDCPACGRSDAMLTIESAEFSALALKDAVPIWKQIREQRERLRPRTHEFTSGCFAALEKFFGEVRLKDITAGQLREYQIARSANLLHAADGVCRPWKMPAGHSTVNHELAALGRILRHCGLWAKLKPYYEPLAIPGWSPRSSLPGEDEERLFDAAAGHEEARLAYWVAAITNNTSAAGCELRGLKLKNLIFREPTPNDEGIDQTPSLVRIPPEIVKNFNRPREIPLNPVALWAFQQCFKRALQCGSCQPDDHLFPFRVRIGTWDPKRPASRSWLRKSWAHLVRIAQLPGLHPHDLRHQFITKLLEKGEKPETVRALAGHVNPKLTLYYTHFRVPVKYAAVMTLVPDKKKPAGKQGVAERKDGTYS